ncbi:MAG: hypothetical protein JWN07_437 [Hyphomicrobiales bacterium]|nr:hypothetical protein [Hyphomicrobiales bacterium]
MGLLDSLIGSLGGGAGSRTSSTSSTSPMVKAILLLLAAKAAQSVTSRTTTIQSGQTGVQPGGWGDLLGGGQTGAGMDAGSLSRGGGLGGGGLGGGGLGGALGGLLGGAGVSGVLGGLLEQLRGSGFGDHVDSWVGSGQNKQIAPHDMARALGPDTLSELEQQTGMPRDQLLDELSVELPSSIDHLTPNGRVPDDSEIWSGQRQ